MDRKNEEHGKSVLRGELMTMRRERSVQLTTDSHINGQRSSAADGCNAC